MRKAKTKKAHVGQRVFTCLHKFIPILESCRNVGDVFCFLRGRPEAAKEPKATLLGCWVDVQHVIGCVMRGGWPEFLLCLTPSDEGDEHGSLNYPGSSGCTCKILQKALRITTTRMFASITFLFCPHQGLLLDGVQKRGESKQLLGEVSGRGWMDLWPRFSLMAEHPLMTQSGASHQHC